MAAPPNPAPIAPSCTPTTLYSTSYKPTTTHIITPSSTQTPISTHSTSVQLRTVCANPPGLGMANCLLPFVQTDNVDVFGSLTWVSIDVTRIETVTETIVQGVKTVPCVRGEETGRPERPEQSPNVSKMASSSPTPTSTGDRAMSSTREAQEQAQATAIGSSSQSIPVQASAVNTSTNTVQISSQASVAGSEPQPSSLSAMEVVSTGTLTSTRYHSSKPSESSTPSVPVNTEPEGKTTTGEIVGIVFGVLVGLMVVGVAIAGLVHWFKRWKERKAAEEIDDDEILAWRKVGKEQVGDYSDDGQPMSGKRFSATPSFFSAVSRLAHLARKPYKSPLLSTAQTYGHAPGAQRQSRGTISSNRFSQTSLGTTVIPHYSQFDSDIPLPPIPPKPPTMPFAARPPSTSATISSFGGDIEALDEKERGGKRLTPWNPPTLLTPRMDSPIRGPWNERRRSSRMNDAYGGVEGE